MSTEPKEYRRNFFEEASGRGSNNCTALFLVMPILALPIKIHQPFYSRAPLGHPVPVCVSQAVYATAVLLLIEGFPFGEFNHSLATPLFTPVVSPVGNARVMPCRPGATVIDMFHVLPA